jgi:hypothetical protein
MSGGRFEYNQYKISDIADSIEEEIRNNGRKKTEQELKEERWRNDYWYKKYPEDLYHYKYPDEVIKEFKKGVKLLRKASVYAHRIDWLLSGDDSEETFLERLKSDLEGLKEGKTVI